MRDSEDLVQAKSRDKRAALVDVYFKNYYGNGGLKIFSNTKNGTTITTSSIREVPGATSIQGYLISDLDLTGKLLSTKLIQITPLPTSNNDPHLSGLIDSCRYPDGSVLLFGLGGGLNPPPAGGVLVKIDANRNIMWAIAGYDNRNCQGSCLSCTVDGGAIFPVNGNVFNAGAGFAKVDANGSVLWAKAINSASAGTNMEYTQGTTFYVNPDNSMVFAYATRSRVLVVAKLDANGDQIWASRWGNPTTLSSPDTWPRAICPTKDGGTVITGFTSKFYTSNQANFVLKLDANGVGVFASVFGGSIVVNWGLTNWIAEAPDGGILTLGDYVGTGVDTKLLMVKLKPNGAFYGGLLLGADGGFTSGTSAYIDNDGSILMTGYIGNFGINEQLLSAKITANGNLAGCQYAKAFSPSPFQSVIYTTTPLSMTITDITASQLPGKVDIFTRLVVQDLATVEQVHCSGKVSSTSSAGSRLEPLFLYSLISLALLPLQWLGYSQQKATFKDNNYSFSPLTADTAVISHEFNECRTSSKRAKVEDSKMLEHPAFKPNPFIGLDGQFMLGALFFELGRKAYNWFTASGEPQEKVETFVLPKDREAKFSLIKKDLQKLQDIISQSEDNEEFKWARWSVDFIQEDLIKLQHKSQVSRSELRELRLDIEELRLDIEDFHKEREEHFKQKQSFPTQNCILKSSPDSIKTKLPSVGRLGIFSGRNPGELSYLPQAKETTKSTYINSNSTDTYNFKP